MGFNAASCFFGAQHVCGRVPCLPPSLFAVIKAANTTPKDYRAAIAVIKGTPPVDNVLV